MNNMHKMLGMYEMRVQLAISALLSPVRAALRRALTQGLSLLP